MSIITQLLENKLPKLLNRYLELDPESKDRLSLLEGKVVTVELLIVNMNFQMIFLDGKIHLKRTDFLPADITIKGTPLTLLNMSLQKDNRKAFFADDVTVEGNLELAQHVIDVFDTVEIDWEEHASQWIGDVPAHHLGNFAKGLRKFNKNLHKTLTQNLNEYLHEEINLAPPREALQDFFQDVDTLRMDTDRLEARLENLCQSLNTSKESSS